MQILVLSSGGLKSAFLIGYAHKEVDCEHVQTLFIDHGQHNLLQERHAAKRLAIHYETTHHEMVLSTENLPPTWAPFKLTLFLWYAFIKARKYNCALVYYGPSKDDERREGTMEYLQRIQQLIYCVQPRYDNFGLPCNDIVEMEAPLLKIGEEHIVKLGTDLEIPFKKSWCCEYNDVIHCGKCSRCKRRIQAFLTAERPDPTIYKGASKPHDEFTIKY